MKLNYFSMNSTTPNGRDLIQVKFVKSHMQGYKERKNAKNIFKLLAYYRKKTRSGNLILKRLINLEKFLIKL